MGESVSTERAQDHQTDRQTYLGQTAGAVHEPRPNEVHADDLPDVRRRLESDHDEEGYARGLAEERRLNATENARSARGNEGQHGDTEGPECADDHDHDGGQAEVLSEEQGEELDRHA